MSSPRCDWAMRQRRQNGKSALLAVESALVHLTRVVPPMQRQGQHWLPTASSLQPQMLLLQHGAASLRRLLASPLRSPGARQRSLFTATPPPAAVVFLAVVAVRCPLQAAPPAAPRLARTLGVQPYLRRARFRCSRTTPRARLRCASRGKRCHQRPLLLLLLLQAAASKVVLVGTFEERSLA